MSDRHGRCSRCESTAEPVYRTHTREAVEPLTLCIMCCGAMRLRPVLTKQESANLDQALFEMVFSKELDAMEQSASETAAKALDGER